METVQTKGLILKAVIIGDGAVGKTSLRKNYLGRSFDTNYLVTIGADFSRKKTQIDSTELTVNFWDLAGQPEHGGVFPAYYTGAQFAIVVFDLTNRLSFANITYWIDLFWKQNGKGKVPFVLLGNKSDLVKEKKVTEEEINTFLEKLRKENPNYAFEYFETSALSGLNVQKAFDCVINDFYSQYKKKTIRK